MSPKSVTIGSDDIILVAPPLIFEPNQPNIATINITFVDDTVLEGNETFTLTATDDSNLTFLRRYQLEGVIVDTDGEFK